MKQKLILAGFIGCIAIAGCKSRFTSTSDSSGPRKYENADPSFQHSGNTGDTSQFSNQKLDSAAAIHMATDTAHLSTDTTHSNAH